MYALKKAKEYAHTFLNSANMEEWGGGTVLSPIYMKEIILCIEGGIYINV